MHNQQEKDDLKALLEQIKFGDNQLEFDFDNMNSTGAQPALTISAVSDDTISLGPNYSYDTITLSNLSPSSTLTGTNPYIYTTNNTGGYTITTGSGGGGYTITTGSGGGGLGSGFNGSSGITWSDFGNVSPGALQVKGDAEFEGDIKIKGKSLVDTLEKIEEKLAIFKPNEKLEEKWEELRELRNRYVELEKEIIEKEKMWDILKK